MKYLIYIFILLINVSTVSAQVKTLTLNLNSPQTQTTSAITKAVSWYYPLTKISFLPIANSLWMPFDNMDNDEVKVESLNFGDEYTDEFGNYRGKHLWYDINKNPYTAVQALGDGIVVASANYLGTKKLEVVFATGNYNTTKRESFTGYQTGIYMSGKYETWVLYYGYRLNRNRWWVVIIAHKKPTLSQNITNIYIKNWSSGTYVTWVYLPKGLSANDDYSNVFYTLYGHIYGMPAVGTVVVKWQNIWYVSPANTPANWYRKESHMHLWIYTVSPRNKSILPWYYNPKTPDSVLSGRMDPIPFIYHYNN